MEWKNCGKNLSSLWNLNFTNGTIGKIETFGTIKIFEELSDLELKVEASKCSLDMSSCDRYPAPTMPDFCTGKYYLTTMKFVQPKLSCPMKPGTYELKMNSVEFPPVFSIVPFDGSVWVATFKLVNREKRNVKACFTIQLKIVRKRVRD